MTIQRYNDTTERRYNGTTIQRNDDTTEQRSNNCLNFDPMLEHGLP